MPFFRASSAIAPSRCGKGLPGSSTILPVDAPDSTRRCASAARDSGRMRSIRTLILPAATAARHLGTSAGERHDAGRRDPHALAPPRDAAPDRVERVLALIQTFDPPGIGARSLAECLAIQLRERNRCDPAMEALLARLDLVAKRDLAALRRICGVDEDDLGEMLAEIRQLFGMSLWLAAGDLIAKIASAYILYEAHQMGLPKHKLLRMGGNVLVDLVFGSVPVAGDVFDVFWRANMRNIKILRDHVEKGGR